VTNKAAPIQSMLFQACSVRVCDARSVIVSFANTRTFYDQRTMLLSRSVCNLFRGREKQAHEHERYTKQRQAYPKYPSKYVSHFIT
jgi:hypothetical protein